MHVMLQLSQIGDIMVDRHISSKGIASALIRQGPEGSWLCYFEAGAVVMQMPRVDVVPDSRLQR